MTRIRESTGGAFESRRRFFIRITVAPQKRQAEHAPWATSLSAANARARIVQGWVDRLRAARQDERRASEAVPGPYRGEGICRG